MVSSTVPRLEDRWPPVWLTDSRMKVRSSSASRCSPFRSRARSATGSSMVFSSSYADGSYSAPASEALPGRSALPIALIERELSRKPESLSDAKAPFPQLELAQHDEIGQFGEPFRAAAQLRKRGLRLLAQFLRERLGSRETERRDVGGLVVRRVLADGLAERRGR